MTFMNKLIYLNSLKLGVLVIFASLSGNAIALTSNTPSRSSHLLADLPSALPPANPPVNSSTTVKVPPLNRPEASVVPTPNTVLTLPKKTQTPAVTNTPAALKPESSHPGYSVPQIIEFGQPLPK